jgi:hypothetical protein
MKPIILLSDNTPHAIGEAFTPAIKVIARALSHINRYTGHVGRYSVAQHCVHVCDNMPAGLKLDGLLHDAPEAYIGDVSAPLKALLPSYQHLENHYHEVIDKYYGVDTRRPAVKLVDLRMLITEAGSFGMDLSYFPDVPSYPFCVERWDSDRAFVEFMTRFETWS